MTNKLYLTIITLSISLVPISAGNRMSFDRSLNLLQKTDGTGIGLSLSRQIMHLHNGSLTLTRSDEKLTVFTLTFR